MKSVLFDLDGTLIDSSEGITKCAQHALAHFGIDEPDLEKLFCFIGPPLTQSFMVHYGFTEEQAKEAVGVYRSRYTPIGIYESRLYPHVKESIVELKKRGYRIGMASSKPEPACRVLLEHFGIIDLFDDVVGATYDGKIGTKEEVLQEVFRRWSDSSKDEMVLIGDTIFDVEGANLCGISAIAVSFGFGNVEEMVEAGAKAVCHDMLELPDLVDGVLKNEA